MKIKLFMSLTVLLCFVITGCSQTPRRQLSSAERSADMAWVFSKFDHNYAPAQYKEELHSFDYEALKAEFLAEAQKDQTNEDFYRLVHRFVAKFKDAHTSAFLTVSALPGRSRIAYLGFAGVRKGDKLVVTSLLPTVKNPKFPIKVGDEISALEGVELKKVIDADLVSHRNLGFDEANYTGLMNSLFTRDLNQFPLPQAENAILSVVRGGKTVEVELPWIVKDASKFTEEQLLAVRAQSPVKQKDLVSLIQNYVPFITTGVLSYSKLIDIFSNTKEENILNKILNYNANVSYFDSFAYFAHFDVWSKIEAAKNFYQVDDEKADKEKKEKEKPKFVSAVPGRQMPLKNYRVPASSTFPSALLVKGEQKVGYIRVASFSPGATEDEAVKELKNTIQYFNDLGVDHLLVDLLNNGGGSLSLGSRMAQAFSAEKIEQPTMDFKLNDTWLDNFENASLAGASDSEREIAKRVFNKFLEDMAKGQKLSVGHKVESLFPFVIEVNEGLSKREKPFKTVLMVNEMCASMCDIFAGILQDNKLAKVFGMQTMGAGGNVTTHFQAPNSGVSIQQTESLIVRSNGEYLENNGVKPDRPYNTFEHLNTKFQGVIAAGVEYLLED